VPESPYPTLHLPHPQRKTLPPGTCLHGPLYTGWILLYWLPNPATFYISTTIPDPLSASSSFQNVFPASGSFQMNQFLTSGGHSIGVSASASILPMNIQD